MKNNNVLMKIAFLLVLVIVLGSIGVYTSLNMLNSNFEESNSLTGKAYGSVPQSFKSRFDKYSPNSGIGNISRVGSILSTAEIISQTVYHVDASYTGNVSDGSIERPWKTISEAAAYNLLPGDIVIVHKGTYRESVKLNHKGTKKGPITYLADGEVIIKGSDQIIGWQPDASQAGCYVHQNWIYKEPYVVESSQVGGGLMLYNKLRKRATDKEIAQFRELYGAENVAVVQDWEQVSPDFAWAQVQKADFSKYYESLGIMLEFTRDYSALNIPPEERDIYWYYPENYWRPYTIVRNWDKGLEFLRKEFPNVLYSLSRNQVFVDEKPLREVVNKEELLATKNAIDQGTFYIDSETKELTVCLADTSDPAQHLMEGSTRDSIVSFREDSSSIIFKGFKLRHASSPIIGRIWADGVPETVEDLHVAENAVALAGTNHVFENNEISDVNGIGFGVGAKMNPGLPAPQLPNYDYAEFNYNLPSYFTLGHIIKSNVIEHSGFLGVAAAQTMGITFHDNTVRYNSFRTRYLNPSWGAGGLKLGVAINWDVKGLQSYYNFYHGIWFDTGCFGNKIRNSVFYGNDAAIRMEWCNAKTPEQGNLISENLLFSNQYGIASNGVGYLTVSNNLAAYNDWGISVVGEVVSPEKTNTITGNLITDNQVANLLYNVYEDNTFFDNNLYYGILECTTAQGEDCSQLSYWKRQQALERGIERLDLSAEEKDELKKQARYVHGYPNWVGWIANRFPYYIKNLSTWQQATDVFSADASFGNYDYAAKEQAAAKFTASYKGTYPSVGPNTTGQTVPLPDEYQTPAYLQIPLKPDQNSVYANPKYLNPVNTNFCLAQDSIARKKSIGPAELRECKIIGSPEVKLPVRSIQKYEE